ncbi:hypothetical protein IFM89_030146, partial [Coptis chinensis]
LLDRWLHKRKRESIFSDSVNHVLLDWPTRLHIAVGVAQDFGLAKMLVKHGESDTMSVVVCSYGYIAPEYTYTTKVNEKIDVYSFGTRDHMYCALPSKRPSNDGGIASPTRCGPRQINAFKKTENMHDADPLRYN